MTGQALPPPGAVRLIIDSRLESVAAVGLCVRALASTVLPAARAAEAELCVVEAVNNAIEHAYANQPGHQVGITLLASPTEGLAVTVCHSGPPPPTALLSPSLDLPPLSDLADLSLEALPEGGFGYALLRDLAEGLSITVLDGLCSLSFHIRRRQTTAAPY